ncbi:MAG: TPR/glycosyl transferase domain protein [Humibacillus sp.]|nr:TPR/glycosyl transferase domain protein [Humibacillus sp.]
MPPPLAAPAAAEPSAAARRLVVSYCFPPYADTAAIVAAKRVAQLGEPVDVVFNAMDAIRSRDPGLVRLCDGLVRRWAALPSRTAFSSWGSISEFRELGLATVERWEAEQGPYAALYSRAQFAASHFLAAEVKMGRPEIVWEAEFSDPLSHDVTGGVRSAPAVDDRALQRLRGAIEAAGHRPPDGLNAFEWCEVAAFALADTVLFTNEHQRDVMLEACHDADLAERVRQVARVSAHPTPPEELYRVADPVLDLDPSRRHLGYFGNVYANRGLTLVLDALTLLPSAVRDRLSLDVFTSKPADLEAEVTRRRLTGVVHARPFVGFLDFLALTRRMDCLLVTDAVSPPGARNPFLPSKWSDYRGSGTPVWGIVEEGSALDAQPLHHRSPVGHATAASHVLLQIASGPRP